MLMFRPPYGAHSELLSGNWSTDLLAGSQFGYKLLFIVLLAGLGAVVLQVSTLLIKGNVMH